MKAVQYALATLVLRVCYALSSLAPIRPQKVVFASARAEHLTDNLKFIAEEMVRQRPDAEYVYLLETYSYSAIGKLLYLVKMMRAVYHLATARLFIIDNAYLPVHVLRHRQGTHVIQVWHAASALKKFGLDAPCPERRAEDRFVHRNYDYVITGSDFAVEPFASALCTPVDHVIALGSARTDLFFDQSKMDAAQRSVYDSYPALLGKKVVLYAPTFRGAGEAKYALCGLDAATLREALPEEYVLACKIHPVVAGESVPPGFDVVIDAHADINEVFLVTDVLVTDYSSSVFDYALLRKPLVLLAPDLDEYRANPGFYIDYPGAMIGETTDSASEVADIITRDAFTMDGYDEFLATHLGRSDGCASRRFVEWAETLD